jgi:rubrerythrin
MATQGIDFSKLTLRDALDLAILIDEEAAERYEEFAVQLQIHHTPEAAAFFHWLAQGEAVHVDDLRGRRTLLFHETPCCVKRACACGVKAPDYDDVRAFMTVRQALETAVHAEERADAFWDQAMAQAADPEVRALFRELHDEEIRQEEWLKRSLGALPPDPELSADDFADEPTEH